MVKVQSMLEPRNDVLILWDHMLRDLLYVHECAQNHQPPPEKNVTLSKQNRQNNKLTLSAS